MKIDFYKKFLYTHKLKVIPAFCHVYGAFPDLRYKYSYTCQTRIPASISFMKEAFKEHADELQEKEIDFYFYSDDKVQDADRGRRLLKEPMVFAYSEIADEYPHVVPIPDYLYDSWPEVGIRSWDETIAKCEKAGSEGWIDNRCFWIGNTATHPTRAILCELGAQYPQYIAATSMHWNEEKRGKKREKLKSDKFVSLEDHTKYKYLVDVQGNGWSTRLKILLHMHRVVFIASRNPQNFFFPYLKDMENCVFVKEDMSDLVDKIKLLESDDALYRKIVSGCDQFAATYGSKAFAKDYFIKQVLRYGLKKL